MRAENCSESPEQVISSNFGGKLRLIDIHEENKWKIKRDKTIAIPGPNEFVFSISDIKVIRDMLNKVIERDNL